MAAMPENRMLIKEQDQEAKARAVWIEEDQKGNLPLDTD